MRAWDLIQHHWEMITLAATSAQQAHPRLHRKKRGIIYKRGGGRKCRHPQEQADLQKQTGMEMPNERRTLRAKWEKPDRRRPIFPVKGSVPINREQAQSTRQ